MYNSTGSYGDQLATQVLPPRDFSRHAGVRLFCCFWRAGRSTGRAQCTADAGMDFRHARMSCREMSGNFTSISRPDGAPSSGRSFPLDLKPHSADWAAKAVSEAQYLSSILREDVRRIYHIGSTSVPGLLAKPTIDLMIEVRSLDALDDSRGALGAAGYEWWGDYGIEGRRLLMRIDPLNDTPAVNAHGFATGSPHLMRHLAFREYLRAHPGRAKAYEAEKLRCRSLAGDDRAAFGRAKQAWVAAEEALAVGWFRPSAIKDVTSTSLQGGGRFHP